MPQPIDREWNGEPHGSCGSCGTTKRPVVDGRCSLCGSLEPEPIQTILPRVMADLATRLPAPKETV